MSKETIERLKMAEELAEKNEASAKLEAEEIVKNAKLSADELLRNSVRDAKAEAEAILSEARTENENIDSLAEESVKPEFERLMEIKEKKEKEAVKLIIQELV